MKAITGKIIKTSFGEMMIYNEQYETLTVGEAITANGKVRKILRIIPPSKPEAKWSILLK